MCVQTTNADQLNSLFRTFVESRPISGLPRYNPIYYWLVASAQFSLMNVFKCIWLMSLQFLVISVQKIK